MKAKELMAKWIRPEGVDWLQAPEVPSSVWRLLSGEIQGIDNYFQSIQSLLAAGITGLGRAVQLGREEEFGDSLDCNMEIIQLLCYLHKGMISEEVHAVYVQFFPLLIKGWWLKNTIPPPILYLEKYLIMQKNCLRL